MLHLEHVSPAILEWDAELRLSRWSRRAEELFGWNGWEVIGLRPEEIPFLAAQDAAALRLVLHQMTTGGKERDASFYRIRTRTDEDRPCAWLSYPLSDRTGRTSTILSMVHEAAGSPGMDIGDSPPRRTAQADPDRPPPPPLQPDPTSFREAFRRTTLPLGITSTTGHWLAANPALCELLGRDETDLLTTDLQHTLPHDAPLLEKHVPERMAAGTIPHYSAERLYTDRNGRHRTLLVRAIPLAATASPPLLLVQAEEITGQTDHHESAPREERTAGSEEKIRGELLAMIRHRVRLPLRMLVERGKRLAESCPAPEQREQAEQLLADGGRILALIDDALRAEEGEHPGRRLNGRRLLLVDEHSQRSIALSQRLQHLGMVPIMVPSTPIALELTAQGIPFDAAIIDAGTADRESLSALCAPSGDRQPLPVLLLFSPDCRISGEELSRLPHLSIIEEPFEQSDILGRLADLFTIHSEAESTMSEPPHLNILIAEDNLINQRVTSVMLEKLGYHPDIAGNGHEVLAALWRKRYDVILMDVEMPEMDGLAATALIRREFPPERQPRIIAMTANAMEGYRTFCLESGMDGYITKPVSREDLREALRDIPPRAAADIVEPSPEAGGERDDMQYLRSLRTALGTDDPAVLGELIDQYLNSTAESIVYLRRKYAERNTTELARIAHSLKSSSRIFGEVRLSELFAELEGAGRTSALELVEDLLTAIVAEFHQARARLESEKGNR